MNAEEKMLNNFIKKYGLKKLERIVELFEIQVSNEVIAKEFEVTRQRVHQWQKAFTISEVKPKGFVAKMLLSSTVPKNIERR